MAKPSRIWNNPWTVIMTEGHRVRQSKLEKWHEIKLHRIGAPNCYIFNQKISVI